MTKSLVRPLALVALASVFAASSATAAVTAYPSKATFAAASTIIAGTDFEADSAGYKSNPFISGGIRFTQLPGGHSNIIPYVAPAGAAGTSPEALSHVLEANGDENFRIELVSGAGFSAVGFTLYTNAYAAPVVSLYAPGGGLIGNYQVPQAANSIGFFGLTSTAAIGWAVMIVDRGWIENTAIDDVRIGSAVSGIPEAPSWAMMIGGFGLAGAIARRRRAQAAA